ncbi:hypothetical protein EG329_013557 [Mollisiaceae sp. DMI_Dod_QoI]|nr:hypothetical protein EG329_013557 [Helotiales sp. DMI_Dod_QoI]
MASAVQGFRLAARSCSCRPAARQNVTRTIGFERAFATTPTRLKRIRARHVVAKMESSNNPLAEEAVAIGKELDSLAEDKTDKGWEVVKQRSHAAYPRNSLPSRAKKPKQTFMNIGDPEPWEYEDTLEDDDDDINSLAHGELEQHREIRHYARLAAWEMPLLSKLAKPFHPPSADMPLRFRYTSYMGEQHPAEKKVVLEFSPADMPNLTAIQKQKLKKLAGARYNPETDIVKMSCEMFETQAQNKRYLGDVVNSLLVEARDPTDTFEDIPLDTRHHHFKPKPRFPREWEITTQRKKELEQYRQQVAMKDQQREIAGHIINGIMQIEEGLKKSVAAREELPEMIMAGSESKTRGKRVAVRR